MDSSASRVKIGCSEAQCAANNVNRDGGPQKRDQEPVKRCPQGPFVNWSLPPILMLNRALDSSEGFEMSSKSVETKKRPQAGCVIRMLVVVHFIRISATLAGESRLLTVAVTIDRGSDTGQSFGTVFETMTEDGQFVVGAGFQDGYNTRLRQDRHAVQFYVRPASGERVIASEYLPRPNTLCGTYLFARDGKIHSTFGGARTWDEVAKQWVAEPDSGGTLETMRVGDRILEFGESEVRCDGRRILSPPDQGSYQLFYYAHGHLCFYHVNRRDGEYRPYRDDADGFSRLYACPWSLDEPQVDLTRAITLTLPIVGETTFAWGQLGSQIVTGSNVGGFYVLESGAWTILREPRLGVSYQLYSTILFNNRLLMGQYPTGRLFEYDGEKITDLADWPPVPAGISASAREAQTTAIYGGELFVGVWPWGELWRYSPDSAKWTFVRRVMSHPEPSADVVHPYDAENHGHEVSNLWGQRVTSLVPNGPDLFLSTSAKYPCEWDAERFPFLAQDLWMSYGSVHRLTAAGHLGAVVKWTPGPTRLEFVLSESTMSIFQDGTQLAETPIADPMWSQLQAGLKLKPPCWGNGTFGQFSGRKIEGNAVIHHPPAVLN